jgi:hypothetical protein
MKDKLLLGEEQQLNSYQINITGSSKQNSFQEEICHSGSAKPPVYYSMTYSQPSKNMAMLPTSTNGNDDKSSCARLKAVDYTPAQSVICELENHEMLSRAHGAKVKSQVSSFCHPPN